MIKRDELGRFLKTGRNICNVSGHIHPLVGINGTGEHVSCGLHVPWNLQYLKLKDNCLKGNKL